jgi:hypothetical protein
MVIGYMLDDPWFNSRQGQEIFLFFQDVQSSFGAHTASSAMGVRIAFQG